LKFELSVRWSRSRRISSAIVEQYSTNRAIGMSIDVSGDCRRAVGRRLELQLVGSPISSSVCVPRPVADTDVVVDRVTGARPPDRSGGHPGRSRASSLRLSRWSQIFHADKRRVVSTHAGRSAGIFVMDDDFQCSDFRKWGGQSFARGCVSSR
jgi:hypothetical protein